MAWESSPCVDAARDGIIELYTSPSLLEELEAVLGRKKFAKRLEETGVTIRELMSGYASLAMVIDVNSIDPVILRDPDDDMVLACAVTAEGKMIVSGDDDLLDLKQYKDIRILTASELLAELSL